MDKEEFSKLLFLLEEPPKKNDDFTSSVKILLLGAREFSGRNTKTGAYDIDKDLADFETKSETYNSKRFIGLFLYLIFLELIGSTFNRVSKASNKNGIKRALDLFSDKTKIKEDHFEEVAGLRNSLAHRFSLCTESSPKSGNPFCYELFWDKQTFIVEKANIKWDGNFPTKTNNSHTRIAVENLIEHIEEIYAKFIAGLKSGELETIPDIPELKARFTIK